MKDIVAKAKKHCLRILSSGRSSSMPFHNEAHTMEVYENVLKIGSYENLAIEEIEPILLAALFHDTGISTFFSGHENFSVSKAGLFLIENDYPNSKSALVIDCINATRIPQKPKNNYEEIICDADLFHLGTKSYSTKKQKLRMEKVKYLGIEYSDEEWNRLNIEFLEGHRFLTKFGIMALEPIKQENLKELIDSINK